MRDERFEVRFGEMCEVKTDLYREAMCLFVSAPQVSCFLGLFIRFSRLF